MVNAKLQLKFKVGDWITILRVDIDISPSTCEGCIGATAPIIKVNRKLIYYYQLNIDSDGNYFIEEKNQMKSTCWKDSEVRKATKEEIRKAKIKMIAQRL